MRLNNLRTFDSLKNSSFRIYYLSMIGQWAAQATQNVVQGLLLYRLTGSTALLGTMALGSAIPQAARIFMVVDVWDALNSDRPYRPKLGEAEALAFIREQAGKEFDPEVVETFARLISRQELTK